MCLPELENVTVKHVLRRLKAAQPKNSINTAQFAHKYIYKYWNFSKWTKAFFNKKTLFRFTQFFFLSVLVFSFGFLVLFETASNPKKKKSWNMIFGKMYKYTLCKLRYPNKIIFFADRRQQKPTKISFGSVNFGFVLNYWVVAAAALAQLTSKQINQRR